jgi:hypothetical protein
MYGMETKTVLQQFASLGIAIPDILLPAPGTDLRKWATIACDQFTQVPTYWEAVHRLVGGAPSTLNLIFPEAYSAEVYGIPDIHHTMTSYLTDGIFAPARRGFVYVERSTQKTPLRRGIILALDLEEYNWQPEARPRIRTTEGTVQERLPARMAVRRGAALETSHVLVLIDDKEDSLIPELANRVKKADPVYDTRLGTTQVDSGRVAGWLVDKLDDWAYMADEFEKLAHKTKNKYGSDFLFAVGDGNHSLAAAKGIWEEYKASHMHDANLMEHPARWALVEVENVYDPGITFKPIHRMLFGLDASKIIDAVSVLPGFECRSVATKAELIWMSRDVSATKNHIGIISGTDYTLVTMEHAGELVTVGLQPVLDALVAQYDCSIDYIHGADELFLLSETTNAAVGILLPPVMKNGFFNTIARNGPLPRKSFSMGDAEEKRFYMECRKLSG